MGREEGKPVVSQGSGGVFLEEFAEELCRGDYGPLDRVLIVLPGKRARLFLNRALGSAAGKPLWAPEVFTMEEFVFDILRLRQADELMLVLALWETCRQTEDFPITFEQFSGWASIVLRDYNDTDLFLADPSRVFANLRDARELQLWSPGEAEELTPHEQLYLEFYSHLHGWYLTMRDQLLSKGLAWQGLAFRMAAEQTDRTIDYCENRTVVFAGFNAFTPSEEKIIATLQRAQLAQLRWDADSYYLDDEMQEAGHFLRHWRQHHPDSSFYKVSNDLTTSPKNISVYGVHGNRAQARLVGELLSEVEKAAPDVAVVLPDESLLLPVLNAIPENIDRFNVTMGLPFKHTPALSWLQLNLRLLAPHASEKEPWIRTARLIPLLRHPWFPSLMKFLQHEEIDAGFADPVSVLKQRFYRHHDLIQLLSKAYPNGADLFEKWLAPVTEPVEWINRMEYLMRQIYQSAAGQESPFDKGAAMESIRILVLARDTLQQQRNTSDGFEMMKYVLSRLLQSASIPFTGEPLEGVQVLGLLETRNLDFRHVIVLSANERILPAGKKPTTLIPYDLRKHHGLPGVQYQDAIFAYHFLHLLQRAQRVDIVYNSDASSEFTGELSRFIRQIESELLPRNTEIQWMHHKLSHELFQQRNMPELSVGKRGVVYDALIDQLVTRGLSPSQLIKYIKCPLMFYFSFVASVDEALTFDETIDFRELGTLVHETLQKIYDPALQANTDGAGGRGEELLLTDSFFEHTIPSVREMVIDEMQQLVGGSRHLTGRNLILVEVAEFMVNRFLQNERHDARENRIAVLAVETQLKWLLEVPSRRPGSGEEEMVPIRFKGVADRVDRHNDTLRITDYKTGKVEEKDLKFKSVQDLFEDVKYDKAFQLMMYSWLYTRNHNPSLPVSSGIFALKNPSKFLLLLDVPEEKSSDDPLPEFEQHLITVCQEILDPEVPFHQTRDTDICRICSYNQVCRTDLMNR